MLYPATCVGFGTGARGLGLSGFSREHDYVRSPVAQVRPVLSGLGTARGLPSAPYTYALQPPIPSGGRTATSPSPRRTHGQYRNVDRSPFGVALRLSLRTRLTLIRLALIRKPWPCGEGVSRPLCRYSYLHLPGRVAPPLRRTGNAPLPMLSSIPRLRQHASCPVIIHARPLD